MRRGLAAVVALSALAVLLVGCDREPPQRSARGRCFPQSPHAESGTKAYPPGYTERGFDRFFDEALAVVGDRVSHEGQGCVEGGQLVADIGVKDLTSTDRSRIEALAPPWVKVNLFGTTYSMDELEAFGDRAGAALDATGLDVYGGHGLYGIPGKVEIYVTKHWFGVERFLAEVVPRDAFVLRVQGRIQLF